MQGTQVRSLAWEVPLEEEMSTYSSILAWRIPWTEKSSGLQSTGLQRIRHNWATEDTHTERPSVFLIPQTMMLQLPALLFLLLLLLLPKLVFYEFLWSARYCSKSYICINSFNPHNHTHFTEETMRLIMSSVYVSKTWNQPSKPGYFSGIERPVPSLLSHSPHSCYPVRCHSAFIKSADSSTLFRHALNTFQSPMTAHILNKILFQALC